MRTLTEIWIYPVKSLAGIPLAEAVVESAGLRHDRRWMLVNGEGRFLTQREIPALALLQPVISGEHLVVYDRRNPDNRIHVPLELPEDAFRPVPVQVWDDQFVAGWNPSDADAWFSKVLGADLRLVRMPASLPRHADARYAPAGNPVSFADGFPFLIIGQATLDDLNGRLETPLPMNRFRPNFVFSGGAPYEEDDWNDFTIGAVRFRGVKPCGRCIITTIDQDTTERGAEPLKTLSTYRQRERRILFGQNVISLGNEGEPVRVGDRLSLS